MFGIFKEAVAKQFERMNGYPMYRVEVEKDALWDTYLGSFPKGTNPIYKERTEHDCQCCKSFIRTVGGVVAVINGKLESIWDVDVCNHKDLDEASDTYQPVADALSSLVKSKPISNVFLHTETTSGIDKNFGEDVNGKVVTWRHFYVKLPEACVVRGDVIGPKQAESRASKDMMLRGLTEITDDAVDTVLDLIKQNSLYRGAEKGEVVKAFKKLKTEFKKLKTDTERDIFCWSKLATTHIGVARIRNDVISTLLTDLSEGVDLEAAVKTFEDKVSGTNYQRTTALVTPGMRDKAKKTIMELGLMSALERRYATIQDITVNNILYANRSAKKAMDGDVFDEIATNETPTSLKNLEKVEQITIDNFIKNVLPTASSIELLLENRHSSNLVSLIAPVDPESQPLFKWPNRFSWSYTGEVADSVRERVKNAGGKVEGDLRCSLGWYNFDDLDLHMIEPDGYEIYFYNKGRLSTCGGMLDVDMNMGHGTTRSPVENIVYADRRSMKEGVYKLIVNNYCKRESINVGFEMEIEFDGTTTLIASPKAVRNGESVVVAEIKYSRKNGFKIVKSMPSSQTVKDMWGLPTQSFHQASVVMMSPNYWDDNAVGNKHYFFMLDGCKNEDKARGFFNEFLRSELAPHRKAMELVGSKMRTEESQNQLSGLGFSSTQPNSVYCRVKGSFNRVLKITF